MLPIVFSLATEPTGNVTPLFSALCSVSWWYYPVPLFPPRCFGDFCSRLLQLSLGLYIPRGRRWFRQQNRVTSPDLLQLLWVRRRPMLTDMSLWQARVIFKMWTFSALRLISISCWAGHFVFETVVVCCRFVWLRNVDSIVWKMMELSRMVYYESCWFE